MRLDQLLVDKNLFDSRTLAQKTIKSGNVIVDGQIILKPSTDVDDASEIKIEKVEHYVSRGAYKLLSALEKFDVDLKDQVVLDIGASTGGFTQVALEAGAKFVYAVDVGHDQLNQKIAQDPRTKNIEGYNFKNGEAGDFMDPTPTVAVTDVSFISLSHIFNTLANFDDIATVVALIKPQFEVGNIRIKNGVVKDGKLVAQTIEQLITSISANGFYLNDFGVSPITGGDGNNEFLGLFTKNASNSELKVAETVKKTYKYSR
ncbi:MAG: TlyA family RNA methyltransferase [Lactobacillaceae bacterium]|nr:TlyA family RNA methyltransferase [Lactobacillaceae bacterium]